jgi:dTMP kinase
MAPWLVGMFISFDGIDGVGKSTQIRLFCDWLRAEEREVVACRDPGSTAVGEAIRELLLGRRGDGMSVSTEMFLYMAARAQLVDEVIRPALAAGKIVVSDRYLLANVVYQGHAGGLDPETIWQVGRAATRGVEPDLTFVLDMPPEAAAARINRQLDRMEERGDDFRARLRAGYLMEARRSKRIVVVDASRDIETVQTDIRRHVEQRLRR